MPYLFIIINATNKIKLIASNLNKIVHICSFHDFQINSTSKSMITTKKTTNGIDLTVKSHSQLMFASPT